jgi:hypothetical protein
MVQHMDVHQAEFGECSGERQILLVDTREGTGAVDTP